MRPPLRAPLRTRSWGLLGFREPARRRARSAAFWISGARASMNLLLDENLKAERISYGDQQRIAAGRTSARGDTEPCYLATSVWSPADTPFDIVRLPVHLRWPGRLPGM